MADKSQDKPASAEVEHVPADKAKQPPAETTDALSIDELESAAGGYADESLDNTGCANALAKCG